jgi:hypothetical protein
MHHTSNGLREPAVLALSRNMTETPAPDEPEEHPKGRLRRFEDAVHDRFIAAEVAAEEAAGYGSLTAAREAAETAVNPAHELGTDEPDPAATTPEPPKE